jgi:predicted DsbA family dithiol-disulfide isomerase
LKTEYGIQTEWIGFPLHPEIPESGMSLEELFRGQPVDVDKIRKRIKKVADDLGYPFQDRSHTYNTRKAQELSHWAKARGKGEQYHHEVFSAYFAEGKNIGKTSILMEIAESIGLSAREAGQVLEDATFSEAVEKDWIYCRENDVTAVPTLKAGNNRLVGAQPYEAMEKMIIESGVQKINSS